LRFRIVNTASEILLNRLPRPLTITELASRYARYAAPVSITVTVRPVVAIAVSAIVIPIIVTIVARVRIALVIRQRIPADVLAERKIEVYKSDECRSPPTAVPIKPATRYPRPIVIVIDPTAVVIRRPSPRFVTDPRPAIRLDPGPGTITIWRPIVISADYRPVRTPNPAEVGRVIPIAVGLEIFRAPNILVVVLDVVFESLGKIAFPVVDPFVRGIERCRDEKLPVAGGGAVGNEFRGASIAQSETGSVRIDACAAAVANGYSNASFSWRVNAVESRLLRGHRRSWSIDFKVLPVAIKPGQTNCSCALY
jgi:hypothetical protein